MLEMFGDIAIGLVLFVIGVLLVFIGGPTPTLSAVRSVARCISGCHHGVSSVWRSDDA
jgi:hypothetical protein